MADLVAGSTAYSTARPLSSIEATAAVASADVREAVKIRETGAADSSRGTAVHRGVRRTLEVLADATTTPPCRTRGAEPSKALTACRLRVAHAVQTLAVTVAGRVVRPIRAAFPLPTHPTWRTGGALLLLLLGGRGRCGHDPQAAKDGQQAAPAWRHIEELGQSVETIVVHAPFLSANRHRRRLIGLAAVPD